eukprot:COSAG02_NODE_4476_length_5322_cov_34.435573_5_plen_300_part_01
MAEEEFEEIYGILLEEVTAEDDTPVEPDTMEMLSEIAMREDAADAEIGMMAAWLGRRLGVQSTTVQLKAIRTLAQLAQEGEAPFKAAAVKEAGNDLSTLASDSKFAEVAGECLDALGLPRPGGGSSAQVPTVDEAALTSKVQAAVMATVESRLAEISQTQFELDARVENLETWLGEVEAAAGFGSPRGSPKPRADDVAKQAMAEAKSGAQRLTDIEKVLQDLSQSGTSGDERLQGVELLLAELEEKVEAGATSAADAKTSLTEHIEGVEAMLVELEEKVEAAGASNGAPTEDTGAAVSEL